MVEALWVRERGCHQKRNLREGTLLPLVVRPRKGTGSMRVHFLIYNTREPTRSFKNV